MLVCKVKYTFSMDDGQSGARSREAVNQIGSSCRKCANIVDMKCIGPISYNFIMTTLSEYGNLILKHFSQLFQVS